MPFSIGFDGGGGGGGVLGSLGTSLSAAMSPYAEGFGGRVRAFLNPDPTLDIEEREQKLAVLRPVYQQAADLQAKSLSQAHFGDHEGAVQTLGAAYNVLKQNGIPEDDMGFKILQTFEDAIRQQKIEATDFSQPPEQVEANLGRLSPNVQTALQVPRNIADIQQSQATTAREQEALKRSKGLYPGELQQQKTANEQAAANLQQDVAAFPLEQTQRRLANEGLLTENEMKELERLNILATGKKIGTASTAQPRNYLHVIQQHALNGQNLMKTALAGKPPALAGMPREPYTPDELDQLAAPYNAYADKLERESGERTARIYFDQGQPVLYTPDPEKPEVTEEHPGTPQPRVSFAPRERAGTVQLPPPGGGRQPPGGGGEQRTQFNLPLTPGVTSAIPDADLGRINMAEIERLAAPAAVPKIRQLKQDMQTALAQAGDDLKARAALVKDFSRRILEVVAEGEKTR
jgi:hypothetical protein